MCSLAGGSISRINPFMSRPFPIPIPVPVPIPVPTPTPTPKPTPTPTPTPIATQTPLQAPIETPTLLQTPTPIASPTPLQTQTSTQATTITLTFRMFFAIIIFIFALGFLLNLIIKTCTFILLDYIIKNLKIDFLYFSLGQ